MEIGRGRRRADDAGGRVFNRKTIYGKAVVATFNDRDAAKLMGINTGLVITFSYALSSYSRFCRCIDRTADPDRRHHGRVLGLKGLCCRHHRRPDQRHGHHRRHHFGLRPPPAISTGYKDVPGLVLLLLVLAFKPPVCSAKRLSRKSERIPQALAASPQG
jgi:branched-chain amino acid transport system permease protein